MKNFVEKIKALWFGWFPTQSMKFLDLTVVAKTVKFDIVVVTKFVILEKAGGYIVIQPGKGYEVTWGSIYYTSSAYAPVNSDEKGKLVKIGLDFSEFSEAVKNGNIVVRSFEA